MKIRLKKNICLLLSLTLVLPNIAIDYSYAQQQNNISKNVKEIREENKDKKKVSNQLEDKFDLDKVSGKDAAIHINKYKVYENFEYAVKQVLNYYYDKNDTIKIDEFNNNIDKRANDIIKDFKEAAKERKLTDLGYVSDEVIIQFEDNVGRNVQSEIIENLDGNIESINNNNTGVIEISNGETIDKALDVYKDNPCIKSVQPNYIYKIDSSYNSSNSYSSSSSKKSSKSSKKTNDSYVNSQYYLDKLKIFDAWNYLKTITTKKVKVAILDTGVDRNHPDLKNNIYLAKDATDGFKNLYKDTTGHGTHIAGIIGASVNNHSGVAGIGNNKIELMPIKVFSKEGNEYVALTSDVVKGYNYAVEKGAKVINMSFGRVIDDNLYNKYEKAEDELLKKAIQNAHAKGVVTVCAAGNENTSLKFYPADFEECISVINIDKNDKKAFDSNYGTKKDISAYGVNIYSSIPYSKGKRYGYKDGSSMSAPIVSGIVALMKSKNYYSSVDQVKSTLYSTADDIGQRGKDVFTGYGRVNALEAVKQTKKHISRFSVNAISSSKTTLTGKAIKGTTIRIYNSKGQQLGSTVVTNSRDEFSVKIPKQSGGTVLTVKATKPGYYDAQKKTTILKTFVTKFTAGNVYTKTSKITGSGLRYSTVRAYARGKQIGNSATINSSGRYYLSIPKQRRGTVITLKITKPGFGYKTLKRTVR